MTDDVLDLAGAAGLLRVSEDAVRKLAAAGRLPGRDIGGEWRFTRTALLGWLGRADDGRTADGAALAAHIRDVAARTGFRETDAEVEAFLARLGGGPPKPARARK